MLGLDGFLLEETDAQAPTGDQLSPLSLLTEGREQVIKVDYKFLLGRVMSVIGVTAPPFFQHIDCGDEGVKVSVKIDAKFPNHPVIPVLEGRVFASTAHAEASAVLKVLSYLEENSLVKVTDFSSRVALDLTLSESNSNALALVESVSQVLDHFEATLGKSYDFLMHVDGDVDPFLGFRDFFSAMLKDYSAQASAVRSKLNIIGRETNRQAQVQAQTKKDAIEKEFFKKVNVPSKFLLDFVLSYLGLTRSKYFNGPDVDGGVEAVAEFSVPYSKHRRFGGNIHITAKGQTSVTAEENAAYKALSFILQNFGVRFVDINYSHRIQAETDNLKLNKMIVDLAQLGESCKEMFSSFTKTISDKFEELDSLSNSAIAKADGGDLFVSYKFLADGLEVIQHGAMQDIDAWLAMTHMIDELSQNLNEINLNDESS